MQATTTPATGARLGPTLRPSPGRHRRPPSAAPAAPTAALPARPAHQARRARRRRRCRRGWEWIRVRERGGVHALEGVPVPARHGMDGPRRQQGHGGGCGPCPDLRGSRPPMSTGPALAARLGAVLCTVLQPVQPWEAPVDVVCESACFSIQAWRVQQQAACWPCCSKRRS